MALDHSKLKKTLHSGGGETWKPREGDNRIRVLPPTTEYFQDPTCLEDLAVQFNAHFFKIDGRPTEFSLCLGDLTPKQTCPACQVFWEHREAADPGLAKMAKDVSRSTIYLFNIIDLNNPDAGIQVFSSNYTCWKEIMKIGSNPDWGDVVHPVEGFNFTITKIPHTKTGTGWPSYDVGVDRNPSSVAEILGQIDGWQETIDNIESQVMDAKNAQEIASLLGEMGFPGFAQHAPGGPTAPTPPASSPTPSPGTPPQNTTPPASSPTPSPGTPPPNSSPSSAPSAAPTQDPSPPPSESPPEASGASQAPSEGGTGHEGMPLHPNAGGQDEKGKPVPANAPQCFSQYNPKIHPCPTCPVQVECQMRMLGVG